MKKYLLLLGVGYLGSGIAAEPVKNKKMDTYQGEEMVTYAPVKKFPKTTQATPSHSTTAEEIETRVNATTVEDTVRYAPGVLIRKRFIGDPNGTLGIRTSNSFQTAHSSVYADGMPLHNPLRTSFSGAPRWSMVAPSEIESTEVLYGPFSAQYGGASFGGVVNLTTRMPEKFEAHMDAMGIFQDMHRAGRNELLTGYKTFLSAGDKMDRFSVFGSYNHFENEGQPQTPRTTTVSNGTTGTAATGGQFENQPTGAPGIVFGDDGIAQQTTDLFKLKMGYDFTDDLKGLFTIAYEERLGKTDDPQSLLKNASGNTLLGGGATTGLSSNSLANGGVFTQAGKTFAVPGSAFSVGESERDALNYGLNLKGKISDNWSIDTTASYYDAFNDSSVSSNLNPNHPLNKNKGQVTDVDAWWAAYDLKLATDKFLDRDDLSFMGGYQLNHAHLNLDVFNSNNYPQQSRDTHTTDSGGETQTNSAFSQLEWRFIPDWSVMAGARFDHWQAIDGHVRDFSKNNIQNFADRDASRVSPKASLEYSPDAWTFRYSFSKAYRFPIAEEMFASVSSLNNLSISAPDLGPENGYFHNFMTQYDIPRGYVRANFFYDQINNEIANTLQNFGSTRVTTFLPIEQTEAVGVDLTFQQNEIFELPVDLMLNGTFIDKQITKNSKNTALVGSQWDRLPKLQANASLTYHIMPAWDSSVSVRYRSDSFQRLDNLDTEANVFGGTDESTFVDLKTNYHLKLHPKLKSTLSAGIDNVFDVNAFENHPYPQRTFFVKASLDY